MTHLEAIFSITDLQKHMGEVKAAAQSGLVRITENGRGSYVFCTEEDYRHALEQAAAEAAAEALIAQAVRDGRRDFAEGRSIEGIDAAWDEIERLAASHGQD